jgi:hypothetical protein
MLTKVKRNEEFLYLIVGAARQKAGTFTLIGNSKRQKKAYRFANSNIPPAIPLY